MADYTKRKRKKGKAREHKRIVKRNRPGYTRPDKSAIRKKVQRATRGAVRQAQKQRQ